MEINYVAIAVATVVQFIIGALWFGPLFGKTWGAIHGFDKLAPEVQQAMMKSMTPFYVLQAVLGLMTAAVFGLFVASLPQEWNVYVLAGFCWLGFIAPIQLAAVIWGGTEGRWMLQKMIIMVCGSLVSLLATALVFSLI